MTFSVFPTDELFDPETEVWRLRGVTISGGVSVGGSTTLSRTDGGGLWTCEQTGIDLWTKEQLLAASALDMQLEAGASPIEVRCFSFPLRPVPEGSDWAVSTDLTADAALRATTLELVHNVGAPLIGGEPFSLTHATHGKRLYKVHSADAAVLVGDLLHQTIRIRPPLREAAVDGASLDFATPGCVMRLVNAESWLSPLDASHEQTAQPVWVEHFDRPE